MNASRFHQPGVKIRSTSRSFSFYLLPQITPSSQLHLRECFLHANPPSSLPAQINHLPNLISTSLSLPVLVDLTWAESLIFFASSMVIYEGGNVVSQARSLWRLELARTKWAGGFVNWLHPMRIKHITTGRYLAVNENNELILCHRWGRRMRRDPWQCFMHDCYMLCLYHVSNTKGLEISLLLN